MNDKYTTFKAQVGIDEIASYLGYKLDRRAGVGRYIEMCLRDGAGRKTDSIIISHPSDKSSQTYFHRNGSSGGDVISLVRENIDSFGVVGNTEQDKLNAVIDKFTGTSYAFNREYDLAGNVSPKVFDASRYIIESAADHFDAVMSYFRQRSISEETVRVFLPYLLRVTDTKAEYKFRNLAFPYRQPGSDTIEGFELRGFKGFKMKAEGTNSSTAAWIADFSDGHPDSVRHVFFAESGYDAMAFYQVNRSRIDLPSSVFVSTGGSFSNIQIHKVSDYYVHARYWDCFDNDKAGILYGIRMEALMNHIMLNIVTTDEGAIIEHRGIKTVRIANDDLSLNRVANEFHLSRHVSVWKAPKDYKDWNDVTMNKPLSPVAQKTKFQRDDNLREKRKNIRQTSGTRNTMKRIYSILTLLSLTLCIHAQQTDPALTAAVTAQTVTLKSLFDARHSTQEKILAATGIENVQLQQLHDIERKVLDYMANVSGLMQNLYQVKRTTELVTVEIPRNIREVTRACQGHLKGTAIALAVSDEIRSVYTEIGSLSALCTSLVKTKTVDGNKVNLLNAAERYWLCEKIVSSLEDINSALYILSWQIQYLSWEDLWRGLDPDTWANYMQGRWMAESCIRDWDDLFK